MAKLVEDDEAPLDGVAAEWSGNGQNQGIGADAAADVHVAGGGLLRVRAVDQRLE